MPSFTKGSVVRSPITRRNYRLGPVIGHGGFGRAYEAWDIKEKKRVCLKYTFDQASWHRESYFGELLQKHRRVIQMYDSFPVVPRGGRGKIKYCLVLELAEHGAVADYLERTEKPWPEARAKREIIALLKLLDQLHGGSATHRDITPFNIFVCKSGTLKLGDFGIARHELAGRVTKPDAFNPDYVTRGFLDSEHRAWTAVDDVFQMGQLLGLLLSGGEPTHRLKRADVRKLPASPETKTVLRRAIGPRSQRYADAWEMLQALRGESVATPPVSTLQDKTVVLSGPLSITRFDAELLVKEAGGRLAPRVTKQTDILVVGRRKRREGTRPAKVARAEQLRRRGHPIAILSEAELRQIAR